MEHPIGQIGQIGHDFTRRILTQDISNLACNHGGKEADHELPIAHQEVRVAAGQEIFSAGQEIFLAEQEIFSAQEEILQLVIANQEVRVAAEQEIFQDHFIKRFCLTFGTLSIQPFRSLHTSSC